MPSDQSEKISVARSMLHLVSSDVREAMRKDPLWRKFDYAARTMVTKLGVRTEDRLRMAVEGPIRVPKHASGHASLDTALCLQQLRGIRHSSARASTELDYRPRYTVAQSMAAFRRCYKTLHGVDAESWRLARHLYAVS
jgi:hypothetical protein